jgi:hypothetical protein
MGTGSSVKAPPTVTRTPTNSLRQDVSIDGVAGQSSVKRSSGSVKSASVKNSSTKVVGGAVNNGFDAIVPAAQTSSRALTSDVSFKNIPPEDVEKMLTAPYRRSVESAKRHSVESSKNKLRGVDQDLILQLMQSSKGASDDKSISSKEKFTESVKLEYHPELYAKVDTFCDSVYFSSFLPLVEADDMFADLVGRVSKHRKYMMKKKTKYPVWTKVFGQRREVDGAFALDRWGSYHERSVNNRW